MSESPHATADARWTTLALTAIALGALALRVAPLLRAAGPLAWPIDYDEGVYFSASALLLRGVLPYRDFVFVHPPGVLYALSVVSWLHDPARAFAASRILASIAGAISTFLAGRIALRAAGPAAAIAAAALYATFPEAVAVERGPFLETALNLACLAAANAWLRDRPLRAGIAAGAACAVKLFGGIWVVAALLTGRRARFLAGAIAAGVVLVVPLFVVAPRQFVEQVLLFQFSRPPDGIVSHAARLPEIFGHVVVTILALVALVTIRERATRFFAVVMLLTVAAFVSSPAYWSQYNSHLAASACVLAGIGTATLLRFVPRRAAMALALLPAVPSLWVSAREARGPDTTLPSIPPNASLFAFEPQCSLVAGQLPPHGDGAPVIVDSYAAMLLETKGTKFRDAGAAFQSPHPQPLIRARLAASRFVILSWRGPWQMNAETRAWFATQFVCDTPRAGDLCLWEKYDPSTRPLIAFGDGWYGEEGTPPQTWRWMSARSLTTLPPIDGPAHLELAIEIPHENLPATIAIELDGRLLDRFTTTKPSETRAYDVDGRATRLIITTNHTVSPPHDARRLGIRLNQLVWRAR